MNRVYDGYGFDKARIDARVRDIKDPAVKAEIERFKKAHDLAVYASQEEACAVLAKQTPAVRAWFLVTKVCQL